MWRNFNDMYLSWQAVQSTINYYDHHQDELIPVAGPGSWNDPDAVWIETLALKLITLGLLLQLKQPMGNCRSRQ